MKIIKPSAEILSITPDALKVIERAGRTCYKSEDLITDAGSEQFVKNILKRDHGSVLEHASASIKFICDRGVSHEIVRHRIASYSQESTRYCNYSKDKFGNEISFIEPSNLSDRAFSIWYESCGRAESSYFSMIACGMKPEQARSVLTTSLKTEVVMTANMREWRHFFNLRCDKRAHPDMQVAAKLALEELHKAVPVVFDDLYEKYIEK